MSNTLLTIVSGSVSASTSIPYILMKRLGVPISCVVLFYLEEEVARHNLQIVKQHIRIIGSKCGSTPLELKAFGIKQDYAISRFADMLREVLSREKQIGNNVYVDATCGRKYISNMLVKIALEFEPPVVDILYCYLSNRGYKGMPCARVPVTCCKVISILREKIVFGL